MHPFTSYISEHLHIREEQVDATLDLLDAGCTIPFISRYRKEATGNLNEVQVAAISDFNDRLKELQKRKDTILKTIDAQGKLTDELRQRIGGSWNATELEDIYLPFKPRRRTRAQVARELGLEPLANILQAQHTQEPEAAARRFVGEGVADAGAALKGAQDIIAERVSENERARQTVRGVFRREATISSRVVPKMRDEDKAQKYSDYFFFSEELRRCPAHRLLAMRRGEDEGVLRVSITVDDDDCTDRLKRFFVHGAGPCQTLVAEAVDDGYRRLLCPSMENEFAAKSKERADDEAIRVFKENLRQLLLAAPLGQKRVMGVDPGIRTGCKVVVLDAQGNLLCHDVVFATGHIADRRKAGEPTPLERFEAIVRQWRVEAIAVGNGTASRETADILRQIPGVPTYVVSEDGASVYSASQLAREEFPDEDVTVRGAVSIGRRLMDPLAELVKIDPKSIGVGQYQHDVDQAKLRHSLDQTVALCVNAVGVDVNTASKQLLTYVSGLGPALAQNIVDYRRDHGAFASRAQLRKVPRLGPAAFQQCAGFLRVHGANPLDASAVHPERYGLVERMAADCGCGVADLMKDAELRKKVDIGRYVSEGVGLPTLRDIMAELEKPGRDPRGKAETFEFDPRVKTPDDLVAGMELPGIVTNITNFGAFVDIGVHQDGLVHVSQLTDHYVKDPSTVVRLHQHVRVKVLDVDRRRHRISLTMRLVSLLVAWVMATTIANAQPALSEYVKVLREAEDPVEYVFRLFETADIVILGERDHRDITQYEFINRLLADPRFAERVGHVYTEVGVVNMTGRANKLVKGAFKSKDEYLEARLDYLRDEDYSFCWEKTNRSVFIDSLYSINSRLPDGKKVTLGLTDVAFDWHKPVTPARYARWYREINADGVRDKKMADNFISQYKRQKPIGGCKKALVITNEPHAVGNPWQGRHGSEGFRIREKLGKGKVRIVCLNWVDTTSDSCPPARGRRKVGRCL